MSDLKGYVVLITKPNDPSLYGPVELSFGLDVRPNETQYFWSSNNASSNFGIRGIKVEGLKRAESSIKAWRQDHPDWKFGVYDVEDPFLPIVIDWAGYKRAIVPAKTLSGVTDKYKARNLSFY